MIYDDIEFHNVSELEEMEGLPGRRIQRFPKRVRTILGFNEHSRGRFASQRSSGCEIRFVTEGNIARVFLSAVEGDADVLIYKGSFFHSYRKIKAGVINTVHLEEPAQFDTIEREALEGRGFASGVWRIMMGNTACVVFHGIDSMGYKIRPPRKDEIPKLSWLAYGSSITNGNGAIMFHNSYVQQASLRLGVDALCNGLGGSCLCEKEVADFIAERGDWDFATLELGVNMRWRLTGEEFEARVKYMLRRICEKHPDKPIAIITIFPNRAQYLLDATNLIYEREREFNEILHQLYSQLGYKNLYLIEGKEILNDFSGLTSDLLHPSDFGHILMGENLADKLRVVLEGII